MKQFVYLLLSMILIFCIITMGCAENAGNIPIKAIKPENTNISLVLGASEDSAHGQINLIITPENATVQTFAYVSSNESVVTVDQEGHLQAVGVGKAKITITPNEDISKVKTICNVTVGQAVTTINIPAKQTIAINKSFTIKPEILPKESTNKKVEFSSSDTDVATVTNSGVIKALKRGKTTITCKAIDGSEVSSTCVLTVIQPVTKVESKTRKIVIFSGKTFNWLVSASPSDATNPKLSYSSDDFWIASVGSNGTITGKRGGKTKVYATSTDGTNKTCVCDVIVEPSVPLSLDSIGYGIYRNDLFGITVTNKCSTMTIVDFDFDLAFYDYGGSMINGGSFSLGKEVRIGPGKQMTIKRNVFGITQAYKTVIGITGVKFSDGTYWSIPSSEQESWQFTRDN